MKLLSFNCRGVASPSKKLALQRLVEVYQPNILLLQETLGDEGKISSFLESLFPLGVLLDLMLGGDREALHWMEYQNNENNWILGV
jgi:hypothetical protein